MIARIPKIILGGESRQILRYCFECIYLVVHGNMSTGLLKPPALELQPTADTAYYTGVLYPLGKILALKLFSGKLCILFNKF